MESQSVARSMTHEEMVWRTLHDPWKMNILDTIVHSMTHGESA
jgi:hypothetical protein